MSSSDSSEEEHSDGPSGFVPHRTTDTRTLISELQDADSEMWVVHCPASIDISKLVGKDIDLPGNSSCIVKVGGQPEAYDVETNELEHNISLIVSAANESWNMVSSKMCGTINISKSVPLPSLSPRVKEEKTVVPFPENLNTERHPIYGCQVPLPGGMSPKKKKKSKRKHTSLDETMDCDMTITGNFEPLECSTQRKSPKKAKSVVAHDADGSFTASFDETSVRSPTKKKKKNKELQEEVTPSHHIDTSLASGKRKRTRTSSSIDEAADGTPVIKAEQENAPKRKKRKLLDI